MSGVRARERLAGGKGGLDGDGRRQNRFAKHDQRQQAVPFGDVMRMPTSSAWSAPPRSASPVRAPRAKRKPGTQRCGIQNMPTHAICMIVMPSAYRRAVTAMARIRRRGSQPLRDHGQPHHDIAGNRGEVGRAVFEHRRHACRQDEGAGDLHEHREPVGHVVAVVRRREPREVHPRPPDREEHHQVADEALERVRLADRVVQPARRLGDGDDEDEIEEELERCGRAVGLVR